MTGSEGVTNPALVLCALLVALGFAVTACGSVGTAATDMLSTTSEPGSTTTFSPGAEMPPIGASVTLPSMTAAVIPPGTLIEQRESYPSGEGPLRLVIDPRARKGFREMTTSDNVPYPGFDFMIFDDGGHSEMGETNLEVYPYGGANFAQIVSTLYDNLSGKTGTVTGYATVDGRQAFLAKATPTFSGEGIETTFDVTATVDPVTKLIIREEWRAEGATAQTVQRGVIEATPELLYRMDVENMDDIAAGYRQVRENGLKDVPFPVYGLPAGYTDQPLTWVIPYPDGRMVDLWYGKPPGDDYIHITTLDPKKYPKYGAEYLAPLDRAWIDPEGAGDLTELRFGIGGLGIQIQARKDIIRQVAHDLIVVGGPGT